VGASLFGAVGALVSVPVVAVIEALVETYGRRYELVANAPASAADTDADAVEPADGE
jgi:predicted PurR-regulated permease PerM